MSCEWGWRRDAPAGRVWGRGEGRVVVQGQGGNGEIVLRGLNEDLMGADAAHDVVDAACAFVEFAFNVQSREFVADNTDFPARGIGCGAVVADRPDFRGCFVFVACAEGAEGVGPPGRGRLVIRGSATALRGNDDPAANEGVFAKLRHGQAVASRNTRKMDAVA